MDTAIPAAVADVAFSPTPAEIAAIRARFCGRHKIYRAGERATHAYVVRHGCVLLYWASRSGSMTGLSLLRPGDTFGEERVLGEEGYRCYAQAYADTEVDRVADSSMEQAVLEHARRRACELEELWRAESAREKLITLAERYGRYFLKTSVAAVLAGMSREMAGRILKSDSSILIYRRLGE